VTPSERLRIAVFIDFDNIEIGVKNTLGASFDAGLVLEALKERGEVVSKMAYSDWQRAGGYSRALSQHAIRMVQRNMTPGGDKNGADINLALDALEMAFTHPHINAFVIVGGDSDFISLVEKLKQYDKKVFVVGGRQFTSEIMKRNCHEFIAYENLVRSTNSGHRRQAGGGQEAKSDRMTIDKALPLVTRAMGVLSERDGAPPLGLLKTTLLQLDSTFDERSYGASSFRDFAQKLEKAGVLKVTQGKGGWMVSPADGMAVAADAAHAADELSAPPATPSPRPERHERHDRSERGERTDRQERQPAETAPVAAAPQTPAALVEVLGTPAEGLREFAKLLASAEIRKWPLYLRNVKQVMRAHTPPFDERAYGFANLTDMLRAAHKDNLVRMERDRQGVIRVFQGTSASVAVAADAIASTPAAVVVDEPIIITTGPEVVDAVVTQIIDVDDDADPNDVNGNVAEPAGGPVAPARDKGKSRRRPAAAAAAPSRGSRRKPTTRKK
jgi:uncharacterized LabA/DUF88 family protein